jgi:hypothetical protein
MTDFIYGNTSLITRNTKHESPPMMPFVPWDKSLYKQIWNLETFRFPPANPFRIGFS